MNGVGLVLICLVFACTGITVVLLKPLVFDLLLPADSSPALKWLLYLATVFPMYQILLLGYGYGLGQFDFFWGKQKKLLLALSRFFNKNPL